MFKSIKSLRLLIEMRKYISNVLLLCTFIPLSTVHSNTDYNLYEYQDVECTDCNSGSTKRWSNGLLIGGALVLAGVTAGIIASSIKHSKKHHSSCNDCGRDVGETLRFVHNLTVDAVTGPAGSIEIIPYIFLPDQTFLVQPMINATSGGSFTLDVTIPDPLFGLYSVCYQINTVDALGTKFDLDIPGVTVFASRYVREVHVGFPDTTGIIVPTSDPIAFNTQAEFQYLRLALP